MDDFFVETFKTSQKIYQETNGLFDPTIGVLVNAYGFGPSQEKIDLNPSKIDSLLQFVGFDKVQLNENGTISKKFRATYFDFNAIAQGYSVDVVVNFLKSKGIKNGIVEIGGEIFAFGRNNVENKNWIVGIDDPTQKPEERTLIAKIKLEKCRTCSGSRGSTNTSAAPLMPVKGDFNSWVKLCRVCSIYT